MDLSLTQNEINRFLSKLTPVDSGCQVWTGERNNNGYGRFPVYRDGRRIWLLSHRVAFSLAQELRGDQVLRHSCDNPPCANTEHLLPGTQSDNMRDAVERGRLSTRGLTAYRDERDSAARARLVTGRKTCRACRVEKRLNDFARSSRNCDGRQYDCTKCRTDRQRERRALKRRAA